MTALNASVHHVRLYTETYIYEREVHIYKETNIYERDVQPSLLHLECHFSNLKNSIDRLVLYVSFATFRRKETEEIEIGQWDETTLQMQ